MKRKLDMDEISELAPTNLKKNSSYNSRNKQKTGPIDMKNMNKRVMEDLSEDLTFKINTREWEIAQPLVMLTYIKKEMRAQLVADVKYKLYKVIFDKMYEDDYKREQNAYKNAQGIKYTPGFLDVMAYIEDCGRDIQEIDEHVKGILSFEYLNPDANKE